MKGPAGRFRVSLNIFLAGAALTAGMALLSITAPTFLSSLDSKLYDAFLGATSPGRPSDIPVIVDLDDKSLARHGQWPWPRYRVASLMKKVRLLGAAVIGVDLVFAEPDRTSLPRMQAELESEFGISLGLTAAETDRLDNDRILSEEFAEGPYVLSYGFFFNGKADGGVSCRLHPLSLARHTTGTGPGATPFFRASGILCNIDILARAAPASGFFNASSDRDGVLRRVPLVIEHDGRFYPSLALAAVMKSRGEDRVLLQSSALGQSLRLGRVSIPLDGRGNLLLRFRGGTESFRYISAADVMDDALPAGSLEGKIVFVGTSAMGLHELRTTPLEFAHPGAEIHAIAVDNILTGEFVNRSLSFRAFELIVVVLSGLGLTFMLRRTRAGWGLLATAAGAALLLYGTYLLLSSRGIYLSPLMPLVTLGIVFPVIESLKYLEEENEVRRRSREFSLAQDAIIQSMASLAETRDQETGGHILRTQHYMLALTRRLSRNPRFTDVLDEATIEMLFKVAPLHDVGKVGVRDDVLLKKGRLTSDEFEEMKRHTTYGSDTLKSAEEHLGGNAFLHMAREIAESHQEKWDGTGYPRGLKGEAIPLCGRLMAVADVYDALISKRIYKASLSHSEAVRIIRDGRGAHFDPDIIDAFVDIQDEFREIARRHTDPSIANIDTPRRSDE